jgi:hypothetical protein
MKAAFLGLAYLAAAAAASPAAAQAREEPDDGKAEIKFTGRWKLPIQAVYVPGGGAATIPVGTVRPGEPFLLDAALAGVPPGKPTPVALRVCDTAGVVLMFGAWRSLPPPEDDECDDDDLGPYPWGEDGEFDLRGPKRPLMKLGIGTAVVVAGAGVLTRLGSNDTVNGTPGPSGRGDGPGTTPGPTVGGAYGVINSRMTAGFQHRIPIGLNPSLLMIAAAVTGVAAMAPVNITGDGNWQPAMAEHAADNSLRGTGRGTFAGFPNTPFTLGGTLNAASGELEIRLTVGGGTLPGGEDAVYEFSARRR